MAAGGAVPCGQAEPIRAGIAGNGHTTAGGTRASGTATVAAHRGPHTTGELAHAWELSPPEVSRHLAVLRRAGLLTARRHGRYVCYTLNLADLMALGADLLAAVLR
ncbi:helix-turn-helix domain-containing protein [Streptosporangium canum]|uniref:ArsR/SmtB family transcription factor n=1 Tax=Streptosporangium canum TaxID=324952 RepID=UPI0034320B9D